MTTNHHTPYPFGGPLTAAAMEAPLGQLDAAIASAIATGSGASTSLTAQALAGQASLTVAASAGFAIGDAIFIGDAGGTHEARVVATVPDGTTITVTVNLTNTYAIGKPVSKSPVEIVDARGTYTSLGGRINAIEGRLFDIKRYGAVGDGLADDTAAIQAACDAADVAGGTVYGPPGTYKLNTGIVLGPRTSLWLDDRATFIAGAALGTMLATSTSWTEDQSIRGGRIDCADLANVGIHLRQYGNFRVSDIRIERYGQTGCRLGDAGLPLGSSEAMLDRVHTFRPPTSAVPVGSIGLLIDSNSTDNVVTQTILNGAAIGAQLNGGANYFVAVHAWCHPTSGRLLTAFDDNASSNIFVGCVADGIDSVGFDLGSSNTGLYGCRAFTRSDSPDNVAIGVKIALASPFATIIGLIATGASGTSRLAKDIEHVDFVATTVLGTVTNANVVLTYTVTNRIRFLQIASALTLGEAVNIALGTATGTKIGTAVTQKLGFYNSTPIVKPAVTGSRGGNAALASLLTQLAALGLITDSSTA